MEASGVIEISSELLREIRQLHFETRHLADRGVSGSYRSAFRGRGMEFEEVREYFPGDDIRSIDWKVTARTRKPYVKSYREERELTVMIAVDVSASSLAATAGQLREQLVAKIGAFLTLVAMRNKDNVGLITFSDRIEAYHPARKARSAVWRILHVVLGEHSPGPGTDLGGALSFLNLVLKRRAVIFIISDFIAKNFESQLAVLGKRHDVTAVLISDPADYKLPDAGLVQVVDPETDSISLIDTGNEAFRRCYEELAEAERSALKGLFRRHRISCIELGTDKPFIAEFRRYFERRSSRLYLSRSHSQSL